MRFATPLCGLIFLLLATSNALSQSSNESGGINIVASIKPLALLAEPLLHESDQLDTLLAANASPHHFSLQVSHLRKLQEADLVLWVGADMERFLIKPLTNIPPVTQLTLEPELNQDLAQNDVHTHLKSQDFHGWLSLQKATAFTIQLGERLAILRPQHQDYYRDRAAAQVERLGQLHSELSSIFAVAHNTGFVAYHPAYSELVDTYKLKQVGVVTMSPEIPASARKLYELQEVSRQGTAKCLFSELSHRSRATDEVAHNLQLRLVVLDPLGQNPKTTSYEALMRQLALDMSACLIE